MSWRLGQAYGQDLRDRVLAANGSIHEVAVRFGVSDSYVARARSKRKRLGETTAGVQRNHVPIRLAGVEAALKARVAEQPSQTLKQLCEWVSAQFGIQVGHTTMWKTLARFGLTLKKSRYVRSNKSEPR